MKFESKNGNRKNAFTLAETMAVLIILGIIAALLVPALLKNYQNAMYRIKLKKAMLTYETAFNNMVVDSGIYRNTDDLVTWANRNRLQDSPCFKSRTYFNIVKSGYNNCVFRTPDGIWWDISNVSNPLVSLKGEITENNNEDLRDNATSIDADKTSFVMTGSLVANSMTRSEIKLNDKAYEDSLEGNENNKAYLAKFWGFINNQKLVANVCNDSICKYQRGDYNKPCTNGTHDSCSSCNTSNYNSCDIYDESGAKIVKKSGCSSQYEDCNVTVTYDSEGKPAKVKTPVYEIDSILYGTDSICNPVMSGTYVTAAQDESCYDSAQCNNDGVCNYFDENGIRRKKIYTCSSGVSGTVYKDISTCSTTQTYKSDGKTVDTKMTNCNHNTGICNQIQIYKNGKVDTTKKNCNMNTGVCGSCTGSMCP